MFEHLELKHFIVMKIKNRCCLAEAWDKTLLAKFNKCVACNLRHLLPYSNHYWISLEFHNHLLQKCAVHTTALILLHSDLGFWQQIDVIDQRKLWLARCSFSNMKNYFYYSTSSSSSFLDMKSVFLRNRMFSVWLVHN